MPSRPTATANISFGLVTIPVRLFGATRSKAVSFNQLHAKDKSRIQQKIYCPVDDAIIDRSELVRGFEVEKDRYVVFTDEELKQLEARDDHSIEIDEFLPLGQIDPIYYEAAYYLGCEAASAKAYKLLANAMAESGQVAVGRYTMRGKEHVALIRPYQKGLVLQTMYYGDEVKSFEEVERGQEAEVKDAELTLAKRLISELTQKKFDPTKYKDHFRERVLEAAQKKMEGQEISEPQPEARKGRVIDLMSALKASLEKRGATAAVEAEPESQKVAVGEKGKPAGRARARAVPKRSSSKR